MTAPTARERSDWQGYADLGRPAGAPASIPVRADGDLNGVAAMKLKCRRDRKIFRR